MNIALALQHGLNLDPEKDFLVVNVGDGQKIEEWNVTTPQPTYSELEVFWSDYSKAEPLRLLKMEVAARLAATDIHALADQTLSPEMQQYRADLRLCYRNAQAGIGTLPTLDAQDQLVYSGFPLLPVPPV